MKKISAFFLAILSCACTALCGGCSKQLDLYSCGLEMTVQMEELVKSDDFGEILLGDSYKTARENLIANDYDTPIKVYSIDVPDRKSILFKIVDIEEETWDELSAVVQEQMLNKVSMQIIIADINSENGIDTYMVASYYSIKKQLDGYSIKKDISYLYTFETGKPIMVTFTSFHGGVQAEAQFLVTDKANSLSALREIFEPFDCAVNVLS